MSIHLRIPWISLISFGYIEVDFVVGEWISLFRQSCFLSSAADGAVEIQALPPRAGDRRDTPMIKWPRRFFDTLHRETLASDVTRSNMSTGKLNLNVQSLLKVSFR